MSGTLNKQVIVAYQQSGKSLLFKNHVSLWDFRDACTKEDCMYLEEHWTFDGQIFYRIKEET